MKVFISQPMNNRTNEEIVAERNKIKDELSKYFDVQILDTLFDFSEKTPIYYLGKSIEVMADADIVVFAKDWENARGCRIEYRCAMEYGKKIMILGDE